MTENNLLSIIIFAPLLGAVINWLIGGKLRNELFSGVVACGTIAVSCLVAFYIAFIADGGAMFAAKPTFDQLSGWRWIICRRYTFVLLRLSAC
jgi:NADH:ubiquinone oxidoreductase subunit 5 (subunit L)/multisubunit Na+/H+ antiporter MnhA subunit